MRWEYKLYTHEQPSGDGLRGGGDLPSEEITTVLNELGDVGWEAVSVFTVAVAEGATNLVAILLKRPTEEA